MKNNKAKLEKAAKEYQEIYKEIAPFLKKQVSANPQPSFVPWVNTSSHVIIANQSSSKGR